MTVRSKKTQQFDNSFFYMSIINLSYFRTEENWNVLEVLSSFAASHA